MAKRKHLSGTPCTLLWCIIWLEWISLLRFCLENGAKNVKVQPVSAARSCQMSPEACCPCKRRLDAQPNYFCSLEEHGCDVSCFRNLHSSRSIDFPRPYLVALQPVLHGSLSWKWSEVDRVCVVVVRDHLVLAGHLHHHLPGPLHPIAVTWKPAQAPEIVWGHHQRRWSF